LEPVDELQRERLDASFFDSLIGGLNLGGSIEPVYNAVNLVEIAIEKGAQHVLVPVSARKQLNDLPDELATRITVSYYADSRDALLKALVE
jgi:ATP-dependent Lon protease